MNSIVTFGKDRIKRSKSTEDIFANLSASLANISFFQLGRMPSNSLQKQVTLRHEGNWNLSQFRSVQYVQNSEQAAAKEKQKANTKAAHNKSLNQIGAKDAPPD